MATTLLPQSTFLGPAIPRPNIPRPAIPSPVIPSTVVPPSNLLPVPPGTPTPAPVAVPPTATTPPPVPTPVPAGAGTPGTPRPTAVTSNSESQLIKLLQGLTHSSNQAEQKRWQREQVIRHRLQQSDQRKRQRELATLKATRDAADAKSKAANEANQYQQNLQQITGSGPINMNAIAAASRMGSAMPASVGGTLPGQSNLTFSGTPALPAPAPTPLPVTPATMGPRPLVPGAPNPVSVGFSPTPVPTGVIGNASAVGNLANSLAYPGQVKPGVGTIPQIPLKGGIAPKLPVPPKPPLT